MIFEECPICFLYYPSLNRLRSCMKGICTECFVQMNTPNSKRTYTRGVENYKGKQYFSEVLIQLMVRKRFWGIQIQMLHSTLIRNRRLIHWLISSSTKHLVLSHHQFLRYTIEASKARLNKCEGLPWIFSEAQTIRENIENVTSFHALSD